MMQKTTIINLNSDNFSSFLDFEGLKVLQFSAEWCGPCRMMSPIVEEIAKTDLGKVIIGKVNIDDDASIAQQYSVKSIPTVLFIKQNIVLDRVQGVLSKEELLKKILSYV